MNTATFAWHGWQLRLPRDWNPVRLEGDRRTGFVLFADLHRPRLGLRWSFIRDRRFDPHDWARHALRDEVGHLAAKEAQALPLDESKWRGSMIYLDQKPPGRDVWVAHSPTSGRVVELIHHARKREPVLAETIVPTLVDQPPEQPIRWAVFDLSCIVPPGMELRAHRLNAGDLKLTFRDRRRMVSVRQIAVAKLALSRMPLDQWLKQEQRTRSRHYRATDLAREITHRCGDGRELVGLIQPMLRRRRFFFMKWLLDELCTVALHDRARDRLILLQSSAQELIDQVARRVGCG